MIQARRQAHFYMVTALCFILPIVAIAAMILRPSVPIVEKNPLFSVANFAEPDDTQIIQAFEPLVIEDVEILANVVQQNTTTYLELTPQKTLEFADILVYWLPPNAPTEMINDRAVLLGQLSGIHRRQFVLSPDSLSESKQLLFYSRAQSQVIGSEQLSPQAGRR